jgi:CRISPR-associated endonuclease/helicase Cas3
VDADSLCTERFCERERVAARAPTDIALSTLAGRLRLHLDALCSEDSAVNRARAEVLRLCRAKALGDPGLFSLTVPTGGGKTLSSLSFALEHAAVRGLRRVVYAIPFTSIVEQNAGVIRDVLERKGERVVLEHHCSLAPKHETTWSSRAAENWDAPVVVTTNVQLYDSLFANSRSRCRRLHRLAGSVIVLDEAQSLPVHVLEPCLAALEELVRYYGCSVVLCTATQPAIVKRADFRIGLEKPREIVDDVAALFAALRRTEVEVVEHKSDEDLVERLLDESQALCIVNTRKHAAELFAGLCARSPDGAFHLSAMMCPEHRSEILERIRTALCAGNECRLVSTQVVEAGVDVDFPLVLRAMAGLDSIAQAAGRCNREGRLERGIVEVFETEWRPPTSVKGAAADAREVLPDHRDDLLSPAAIEAYFALHYWQRESEWDKADVLRCFQMDHGGTYPYLADFCDAASRFRMIDDAQTTVVVPFAKGEALLDELRRVERPDRGLLRKLQRYTVGVYEGQLKTMLERRLVFEHCAGGGLYLLANKDAYDEALGLCPDAASGSDAMII